MLASALEDINTKNLLFPQKLQTNNYILYFNYVFTFTVFYV